MRFLKHDPAEFRRQGRAVLLLGALMTVASLAGIGFLAAGRPANPYSAGLPFLGSLLGLGLLGVGMSHLCEARTLRFSAELERRRRRQKSQSA